MIDLKINKKKDCTGCFACENICPTNCVAMNNDEEGFWYPKVDHEKCIKCGKCIDVCPIINKTTVQNDPIAYACINKDESIRMISSSGGIFTLLAQQVIADKGVVFGSRLNNKFEAEHSFANTKEELEKFRGSKYVQSKIGDSYKQVNNLLSSGKLVLFSGTPCQIAGLKSFISQPYDNLICMDIVCHGVPSPDVWQKYIKYREEKAGAKAKTINFRSKAKGWKRFAMSFLFMNNIEYCEVWEKDLYMRAFLNNVCLRPSCYSCEFKTLHRQSDITLADFWGIENVLPGIDDDKGTSLVFINSKAGKTIFEQIAVKMYFNEVDINKAIKYNCAANTSVKFNPNREKFFEKLNKLSFDRLVKKYCRDSILVIIKSKSIALIYKVLKRIGLVSLIKKLLNKKF